MTPARLALGLGALSVVGLALSLMVPDFWWTRDQQALRSLRDGDAARAAELFVDPQWRGIAHYRNGDFERAAGLFSGGSTADAAFNRGNALAFLGKYDDAIASYELALERQPDWQEARENRDLARARAAALDFEAGNMTGGRLGADDIVFDQTSGEGSGSEDVEVTDGEPMSGAELRAVWLRNVQTKPADFLRLKFGYQLSQRGAGEDDS